MITETPNNANGDTTNKTGLDVDPYLWLEEVEGEKALAWVAAQNLRTAKTFHSHPLYGEFKRKFSELLFDQDKIPVPQLEHGQIYNFWQDETHPRGLLRRTTIENYQKEEPWEIVLDIDQLAKSEGENWVYQGITFLPRATCGLICLSRGGKDAHVIREFDFAANKFIDSGFDLPESKGWAQWLDADQLLISRDFGVGSLTKSGYPRQIKLLKRHSSIEMAPVIFEIPESSIFTGVGIAADDRTKIVFHDYPSFFTEKLYYAPSSASALNESGGVFSKLQLSPLPESADCREIFGDKIILTLRRPLKRGTSAVIPTGSVVALPYGADSLDQLTVIFSPSPAEALQDLRRTSDALYLNILRDLQPGLIRVTPEANGKWNLQEIPLSENSTVSLLPSGPEENSLLIQSQSFLQPPEIFQVHGQTLKCLKKSKHRFASDSLTARQGFAVSCDGTRIPYFIVHKKELLKSGDHPTLLYGYGGFESAVLPDYSSVRGTALLEKGGIYVVANIRGGGEYGPNWHQAAILENRQRAYDDFTAVAKHLIADGITSPRHLVINGGSNGGLLMGAMYTQQPHLFQGVVCAVPLLDMLRFHKLLAGASWMAEYGDPEDPKMRKVLAAYSPYQNTAQGKDYPEIFFTTSTKDDRVHPGHARKMAARLEEFGLPFRFFENVDGGHSGAKDIPETVDRFAMIYSFFWAKISESNCPSPHPRGSRNTARPTAAS